jgi:type II secretory pathway pseudopilin PulG
MFTKISKQRGFMLLQTLVFAGIAVLALTALIGWAGVSVRSAKHALYREQAFQIAEAGIDYYRWHLAHAPTDYQDGTGAAGPYFHSFLDLYGATIGRYTLTITPPSIGSTKVTVRSKGEVFADTGATRTVEVQFAKPSWAKYAAVSNAGIWFGISETIYGPVHSNSGVRVDGIAYNTVSSAISSYDDPVHNDTNKEFAVHTHRNPPPGGASTVQSFRPLEAPPNPVPSRSDVFVGGRQFPVPAVDFSGITNNLQDYKTKAQAAGFYRASSGVAGYHVVLKTNDTFDLYKVNSLVNPGNGCSNSSNSSSQPGWGSWSVGTTGGAQTLLGNYAFPSNGVMFFEDHVWVDGTINSARVTIASGRFPVSSATYTNIIVNDNLRYTNTDGQDTIALIAQGKVLIGLRSADTMRIDAAMIAQNEWIGRYYYGSNSCQTDLRTLLTLYGMQATNQSGGFAWDNNGTIISGYQTQISYYDPNLLYSPPPSFPLLSDQYQTLYWQEIK